MSVARWLDWAGWLALGYGGYALLLRLLVLAEPLLHLET